MIADVTDALVELGNEIAHLAGPQKGVAAVVTVPPCVYAAIVSHMYSATYMLRRAGFDDDPNLRDGGMIRIETLGGTIVVKVDSG